MFRAFDLYAPMPDDTAGSVVAIGNFDGVHLGHQAVIGVAGRLAREEKLKLSILTFEPHPRRYFKPAEPPFLLSPGAVKQRLFAILSVDQHFIAPFDKKMAEKSATQFVQDVLVDRIKAKHVVVGEQFMFGYERSGSADFLKQKGRDGGFNAITVRAARDPAGLLYSSSRVRDALAKGDMKTAAQILARPWQVEGVVIQGQQLARELGFPTANFMMGDYFRPAYGSYAVRVGLGQGAMTVWHNGVANFGKRPTVNGEGEVFEAHIFDIHQDLYGQEIKVQLIEMIRPEAKHANMGSLRQQIGLDAEFARQLLAERFG